MADKSEQLLDLITNGLGLGGVVLGATALALPDTLDRRLGFGLRQTAWGSFSLRSVGTRNLLFGVGLLTARAKGRPTASGWQALFGLALAVDALSCVVERNKPGANGWMSLTAWGLPVVSAAALAGSAAMRKEKAK